MHILLGLYTSLAMSCKPYLLELCCPVAGECGRHLLCSATQGELAVLRLLNATRRRRALSVVGPETRNGLLESLHLTPSISSAMFTLGLKTILVDHNWAGNASEWKGHYINWQQ